MAVTRLNFDIAPIAYPFRARTTEHEVIFDSDIRGFTQVPPSWIENLWPLSGDQAGAIVSEYGAVTDLPAEVVALFGEEVILAYGMEDLTGGKSILVTTNQQAWAHTAIGWVKLLEAPISTHTSVASSKGNTYLHQAGGELQVIATATNITVPYEAVEEVTTNGVDFTQMISMCAAISYLVATDGVSIYWSAPLDVTQWQPDQAGDQFGAGATKVLAVSGAIRFLKQTADGFYIFTDTNIISARYTENAESPWSFTEVANSSGSFEQWSVAGDHNLGTLFAWCDNGLAAVNPNQAQYGFTEVTEFLSGSIIEEFTLATNTIATQTNINLDFQLTFIGSRYLAISYGELAEVRKYMLVLDLLLAKWFRIKLDHVAVLDIRQSAADQGIIFDNWLDTFDNSLYTFDEMGGSRATSDVKATTISVILADGTIRRLSPVDLHTLDPDTADYTDLTFEVLANILHYSDIKLSRSTETTLSEFNIFYSYPAYQDEAAAPGTTENVQYSTVDTLVQGFSQEDPTIREFLLARARDNTELRTQRVLGTRVSATLKNVSSLQSVEIGLISSGVRR